MFFMNNNLEQKIRETGFKKLEIAKKKGITPETLSRHISGKIQLTKRDADEYAKLLNCTSVEILYPQKPIILMGEWSVGLNGEGKKKLKLECAQEKYPDERHDFYINFHATAETMLACVYYNYTRQELTDCNMELTPWWTPHKIDVIAVNEGFPRVDERCFMNLSYCRDVDDNIRLGYIYPEPGFDKFTVHLPSSSTLLREGYDSTVTGVRLAWAVPIIQSIWRTDLTSFDRVITQRKKD